MKPRQEAKRQTATIPAVRMFSEELKLIKQASAAQRISLSEFIRRALLSFIPKPVDSIVVKELRNASLEEEEQSESGGRVSSSQNVSSSSRQKCIHGFKVTRGATQCFTCANMGVKLSQ